MGETSSRKRRRDSSASRSRSRSRAHKGSTRETTRRGRSRSESRPRSRKHSRSSRRSKSRSRSRSRSSAASSRSRSRSRSTSRRDKDRKHARRSRRSSSPSSASRKDRKKTHKTKKSSRDKRDSRRRDRDRDHDGRSRSRSRVRSHSRSRKEKKSDEKTPVVVVAADAAAVAATPAAAAAVEMTMPVVVAPTPLVPDVKVHASRRSRSPVRSSRRSRSRSRGRTAPAATPPAAALEKKKEAPKPLTFTGISLKATKSKSNGIVPSSTAVLLNKTEDTVTVDDEKQRRREKLKLWREQQLKQKEDDEEQKKLVSNFLAADDPVPARIKLWSLDEAGQEKQESVEEKQKREKHEEEQRQREQKVVDEVDPLDAFMAGLVDEAAIQQSIANPAANVISLDEIQSQDKLNIYGTFLPQSETNAQARNARTSKRQTESESTKIQSHETEQEREAREERELKEFMRALREKREQEEKEARASSAEDVESAGASAGVKKDETGRIYQGDLEDFIGETADTVDNRSALEILQDAQKKKDIQAVDHTQMDYIPFQKKFYLVPNEIKNLSEEEVQTLRDELEIKIRGKNCPRPLDKWTQCGFSVRMLQLIQKQGYTEPFAIQRQALPAIMSGRDVIGIAKTGSGKTLAFLLPMFRHILHQPPLKEGEGPIGLVMAPARELAQQIYVEAKKFAKGLGMRTTAVYGGSSVSEQIGNLKRGSDIVICTPGRMIDILCMNAGKVVSLKRVTYVVLDEADRMFDMGFEPQITKIMMNIRPDRQTLLFSATFPKAVETLARKVLKKPVEITVGARSTASGDIAQYVEVRDEKDKFMRLLQLLGLWYEKGNILVFVNTQQACDQLFQDLMKAGYPGLSLHGGKDQVDRDFTIDDFKRKVRTLMVATSVAGRGLDVKDLVLVINYHCPNHLEDYVHRVGRTGRAGRKGTAYTFISPDEEEYSVDLVKALESGKQVVPPELTELADRFKERVRKGEARYHGSGFKGKGFTFDDSEKNESQRAAAMQKRQYELQEGIAVENHDASDDDDADSVEDAPTAPTAASSTQQTVSVAAPLDNDALSAVRKAQQIAQILDRQYKQSQPGASGTDDESHFQEELEINEYPQQARWKVTQKEATERVAELTGAAVITRGSYVPAGRKPNPGERKLYLAIEGPSQIAVMDAKRELQRILDETTLQVGLGNDRYGKYNL